MKYETPNMDIEIWGKSDIVRTSVPGAGGTGDGPGVEDNTPEGWT